MLSGPRMWVLVGALATLALVVSIFADTTAARAAALEEVSGRGLDELAVLAGIGERPLGVDIVQDGGSTYIRGAVMEAVEANPRFELGTSPFMLRIETVEGARGLAVQLHLWRQGWSLRLPHASAVRMTPWAAVLGAALGALLGLWFRRLSVGVALAGLLAQLGMWATPSDTLVHRTTWWAEVWDGPLAGGLMGLTARAGSTTTTAVGAAVIVFCLVLVAFDHRRSQGKSGSLDLGTASVLAFLGTLGSLAWVEAAFRSGFVASMAGPAGIAALVALTCAWLPVAYTAGLRARVGS